MPANKTNAARITEQEATAPTLPNASPGSDFRAIRRPPKVESTTTSI